MSQYSDQEIIERSRSLRYGVDAQREALAEARRRGIFDASAHLKASPVAIAFFK